MHLIKCIVGAPISVAELATFKIYPPKFLAIVVFKTRMACTSPMHITAICGQSNHVHCTLLIRIGVVREKKTLFHIQILA